MNMGDTVFMFVATVMVMLMTPGLALFYGGMVRSKNVLSTTMHSYSAMAIVSIQWIVIGYSLSFGPDWHGLIGTLDWFGLNGVTYAPNPDYSSTIPHNLFMMFQLMFAILTPALISGAFAERMRFSAFLIFILLWTTIVYNPVAHWVWGVGGWLRELGALDFAGGNVVHITSGVAGLVLAIFLGKRKNINGSSPHHLPFTMLGAGLLWFGWFGFNVGSALSLNDVALTAFINTNIAAAASALTWMLSEWFFQSKPTAMGACLWRRFRSSRYYTSLRVRYTFLRSSYRSDWRRIMLRSSLFLKNKIRIRRYTRCIRMSRHRRNLGRYCDRTICNYYRKRRWR